MKDHFSGGRPKGIGGHSGTFQCYGTAIAVDWRLAGGATLHLLANLCDETAPVGERAKGAEEIFSLGSIIGGSLAPWSVIWSITQARSDSLDQRNV